MLSSPVARARHKHVAAWAGAARRRASASNLGGTRPTRDRLRVGSDVRDRTTAWLQDESLKFPLFKEVFSATSITMVLAKPSSPALSFGRYIHSPIQWSTRLGYNKGSSGFQTGAGATQLKGIDYSLKNDVFAQGRSCVFLKELGRYPLNPSQNPNILPSK